jgi:hypothetical protein
MLPDFPETKRLFARAFQTYMRRKAREVSPYSMVQTHHLHEGRTMQIVRSDKSESESALVQMSSLIEFKLDEIEDLTLEKVVAKIDATVVDIVRQQVSLVRERLSTELPESQTVDGKGRKFDGEIVLQALDRMQMEFYPDGTPHEIFVDAPPEKIAAAMKEIENSPELKKRHEELVQKKREEWCAREADRKLVG